MTGKIIGLGAYLPEKVLTNDDLSKMVETNDEWITERTGIKERRISDPLTDKPSQMVVKAALQAVEDAGIDPKEIDLIITASTTSDLMFPTLSCVIHEALGCSEECGTFDVNSACPGWIAAFNAAQGFIETAQSLRLLQALSAHPTSLTGKTEVSASFSVTAQVLRSSEPRKASPTSSS